jgi:glucosamine-6-phosphate deaminase
MTIRNHPTIEIHETRAAMGRAAARSFQRRIEEVLQIKPRCRVIVGCAPSQNEFFEALVREACQTAALWRRVELFHMDDYVGLEDSHGQSFRTYLRRHFLDNVAVAAFHPILGEAPDATAEARRYAALLAAAPIDIIGMGIGENGHVAFNDPPVADFSDPALVKVVEMDHACRQQQVNDGCFAELSLVPRLALTITLPVFARAGSLHAIVPGIRKAVAVRNTLLGPVGPACPGTVLRVHPQSYLFLDHDAASHYAAAVSA